MAEWLFRKDEKGRTSMVPKSEVQAFTPQEKPGTPEVNAAGSVAQETVYSCKVGGCKQKFLRPNLFARHFNARHSDLVEDKDTWREHFDRG